MCLKGKWNSFVFSVHSLKPHWIQWSSQLVSIKSCEKSGGHIHKCFIFNTRVECLIITEKQYGLVETEKVWDAGALFLALSLTYCMIEGKARSLLLSLDSKRQSLPEDLTMCFYSSYPPKAWVLMGSLCAVLIILISMFLNGWKRLTYKYIHRTVCLCIT